MLALDAHTIIKTDEEPLPITCLNCGHIYTPPQMPKDRVRIYLKNSTCPRCSRVNKHADCAPWVEVGTSDVVE